jgi:DNA-binding MarR family transcriptional regulator
LERAWIRIQDFQAQPGARLLLRPRQEEMLKLLRERGSMAPKEIWEALGVSRQGAIDLLRPLLDAGLVEKVGGKRTGRYVAR